MRPTRAKCRCGRGLRCPRLVFRRKVAGIVPSRDPMPVGPVGLAHLRVGHEHMGVMAGSSAFRSALTDRRSSRSSAGIRTMVWSPCWTMYGVLLTVQYAAHRSTIEQNANMATGRDGRDDALREYSGALRQAAEALTAGGRRRRWKEVSGWLSTLISPAVGTISRLGGNRRGCRRGYPFGSRGISAATGKAERSEGVGFPRDCITPVATARVSSPGTRTLTGGETRISAQDGHVTTKNESNVLALRLRRWKSAQGIVT